MTHATGERMSLHHFTGDYVTAGGYTARFRVVGRRLCLQLTDRSFIPLDSVGDAEFGVPFCVDFGVRFDVGSDEVESGVLLMGGEARGFRRDVNTHVP
jgi:hypothetical protein